MAKAQTMKEAANQLGDRLIPIRVGDLIEVTILKISKSRILVDVEGLTLGIIPEQEFSPDISDLKTKSKILAYVLAQENDEGFVILSLRRADKEKVAKVLAEKFETGEVLQVKITGANKGGLLCQFGDYEGFLPVSHLATAHYPKVDSGNREEILNRLKKLVGQIFHVKVLNFEADNKKLIFSEKAAGDQILKDKISKLQVGQKLEGEVTGIVNFGLFVKVKIPNGEEDMMEGLVHISEASWDHIDDLNKKFQAGQKVKVEIISTENNRLSLSLKRMIADPWLKEAEKFKKGEIVTGKITKITPFGAFAKVGKLDGLVHISELGEKISDPRVVVEEGKNYEFKILSIEPELHKLSLSFKAATKTQKSPKKTVEVKKKSPILRKTKKKVREKK